MLDYTEYDDNESSKPKNISEKIWHDLSALNTDNEIISYWENKHNRFTNKLLNEEIDLDLCTLILHKFTRSFNNSEKYSTVFYLHQLVYIPLETKLKNTNFINELKYQLAKGLHHNRKYAQSTQLFNELALSGYDTKRIDDWWNQSAYAGIRDKIWLRTFFLPFIVNTLIIISYIFIATSSQEFIISTTIFVLVYELFELWDNNNKTTTYLKDFKGTKGLALIRKRLSQILLIKMLFSLLFFLFYIMDIASMNSLVAVFSTCLFLYQIGFNVYYFPKLIGEINRKYTNQIKIINSKLDK